MGCWNLHPTTIRVCWLYVLKVRFSLNAAMARSSKEATNGLDAVKWVGALCDSCFSSLVQLQSSGMAPFNGRCVDKQMHTADYEDASGRLLADTEVLMGHQEGISGPGWKRCWD